MLSFQITDSLTKILKDINIIASEKARVLASITEEAREAIGRYARISLIGSTTRVENAVLTDPEISWMDETLRKDGRPTAFLKDKVYIENKLSKQKERSIEEVAGCRDMLAILFQQAGDLFPLAEATIKGLHRELLKYYPPAEPYLGNYKIVPNNVVEMVMGTDIKRDVLKTADPGPITDAAMRELVDWYNGEIKEHPWAVAVASEFVFRFLAIHPFQDGNGRIGRALFHLSLLQSGEEHIKKVIPYIAIDRHIEKQKEEYYSVLRRCSDGKFSQNPADYRLEHFLKFMLKMLHESISSDVDFYVKKYEHYVKLSDAQIKVFACFKEHPEKKIGLKEILGAVNMPRRTAIHALGALVDGNFLQKMGSGPATKYRLTF